MGAEAIVLREPIASASGDEVLKQLQGTLEGASSIEAFITFVNENGGIAIFGDGLVAAKLGEVLRDSNKKLAARRTRACKLMKALLVSLGHAAEPFLIPLLTPVLVVVSDKNDKNAQEAARETVEYVVQSTMPQSKKMNVLPQLLGVMMPEARWQTLEIAARMVTIIAKEAPDEAGSSSPNIVPAVFPFMTDAKAQVAQRATEAIQALCASIDNTDVQPLVPSLVSALRTPTEVEDCIFKLASTTFVQQVERDALAITVPLLKRGFQSRKTPAMRMCARIIENMAKLVERRSDIEPFLPALMPALQRAAEEISDPEARSVCASAVEVLDSRSKGVGMDAEAPRAEREKVLMTLRSCVPPSASAEAEKKVAAEGDGEQPPPVSTGAPLGELFNASLAYVTDSCMSLIENKSMSVDEWKSCVRPYLSVYANEALGGGGAGALDLLLVNMLRSCEKFVQIEEEEEEEEDSEQLCDCKFSLAYGNKVLFNNTRMQLKRGYRYGLVGGNESGKTTLMRSIANGQVEGFPSPDEVRTVFVEADILGELSHLNIIDYIYADERIRRFDIPRKEIENVLSSVGFTEVMVRGGVSHLSGGWRMKLALARAMLQKADILLMDEPTNHLDVVNVRWVEEYLLGLKDVTSIIVSHDSGLLERVCTHILQIDALKLKSHRGNLSEFVKKVPAASAYFELKSSKVKFNFPAPGVLEGITSKGKAIMKMDGVEFTYPGVHRPQVSGVTVRIALASRVACIGPNGAGKSTMIKLLTGELVPQVGSVWKHPNCRVAYVAQHAFHHIENHLEKTPNQYIQWRYQYGDDKEALVKATMKMTDADVALMKQPIPFTWKSEDGARTFTEKLVVKDLTSQRRTVRGTRNDYEYEATFESKPSTFTMWLDTERLVKGGWGKHVKAVDEKVAARAASYETPLTSSNVEKHLENVGLDREYGTHTRLGALSGGQKVKVVLAAAMWMHPHIVILDEPTNYLDRESLGALADAIRAFDGGVVIVSHNSQFTQAVCPETWVMTPATDTQPAHLNVKGDAEWMKEAMKEKVEIKQIEEMVDAFGNTVKVKPMKKKLSRGDKKKLERKRAAQKRNGEYFPGINGSDDEDLGDE